MERKRSRLRRVVESTERDVLEDFRGALLYPQSHFARLTRDLRRSQLADVTFCDADDGSIHYQLTWTESGRVRTHSGGAVPRSAAAGTATDLLLLDFPKSIRPLSLLEGNFFTDSGLEHEVWLQENHPVHRQPATGGASYDAAHSLWSLSADSDDDDLLLLEDPSAAGGRDSDVWSVAWVSTDLKIELRSRRKLPEQIPVVVDVHYENADGHDMQLNPPIHGLLVLAQSVDDQRTDSKPTWELKLNTAPPKRPALPNGVEVPVKVALRSVDSKEMIELNGAGPDSVIGEVSPFLAAHEFEVYVGYLDGDHGYFRDARHVMDNRNSGHSVLRVVSREAEQEDVVPFEETINAAGVGLGNYQARVERMWQIVYDGYLVKMLRRTRADGIEHYRQVGAISEKQPFGTFENNVVAYWTSFAEWKIRQPELLEKLKSILEKEGQRAAREYFTTIIRNEISRARQVHSGERPADFYKRSRNPSATSTDITSNQPTARPRLEFVGMGSEESDDEGENGQPLDPADLRHNAAKLADHAQFGDPSSWIDEFVSGQREIDAGDAAIEAWLAKSRKPAGKVIGALPDAAVATELNAIFDKSLTGDAVNDLVHNINRRWAVFLVGKRLGRVGAGDGLLTKEDWSRLKYRLQGGKRGNSPADNKIDLMVAAIALCSCNAISADDLDFIERWLLRGWDTIELLREDESSRGEPDAERLTRLDQRRTRIGRALHAQVLCDHRRLPKRPAELATHWLIKGHDFATTVKKMEAMVENNKYRQEENRRRRKRSSNTRPLEIDEYLQTLQAKWADFDSLVPAEYRCLPEVDPDFGQSVAVS